MVDNSPSQQDPALTFLPRRPPVPAASLEDLPAWIYLLAQAKGDVVELERKLPPELVQKVVGRWMRLN